jgi:hypothetical protein
MSALPLLKHQEQLAPQAMPDFGLLTTVTELSHYDLIYVLHKLRNGTELELVHDKDNPLNPWSVDVFAFGFKIGVLAGHCDRMTVRMMEQGRMLRAILKSPEVNRFRPFEGLEVEIRASLPHVLKSA